MTDYEIPNPEPKEIDEKNWLDEAHLLERRAQGRARGGEVRQLPVLPRTPPTSPTAGTRSCGSSWAANGGASGGRRSRRRDRRGRVVAARDRYAKHDWSDPRCSRCLKTAPRVKTAEQSPRCGCGSGCIRPRVTATPKPRPLRTGRATSAKRTPCSVRRAEGDFGPDEPAEKGDFSRRPRMPRPRRKSARAEAHRVRALQHFRHAEPAGRTKKPFRTPVIWARVCTRRACSATTPRSSCTEAATRRSRSSNEICSGDRSTCCT